MTTIHHLNCGRLSVPGYPPVVCHCLLLEDPAGLALVDAGIGLKDVLDPSRLGAELIEQAGFQLSEADTAIRLIEKQGLDPRQLRHLILTHADPDHAGGLADFPDAQVHVSAEELANIERGLPRYVARHFEHQPRWQVSNSRQCDWFGLSAQRLNLGFESEVVMVPLPGHTAGHCGIAIRQANRWVLHVGDAYYLRLELERDDHPVSALAASRADDDALRRSSLNQIRRLMREHGDVITVLGYHDVTELWMCGV